MKNLYKTIKAIALPVIAGVMLSGCTSESVETSLESIANSQKELVEITSQQYQNDTASAKLTTQDPGYIIVSTQDPVVEGDMIFDAGKTYQDSVIAPYLNSKAALANKYNIPADVYKPKVTSKKSSSKKNSTRHYKSHKKSSSKKHNYSSKNNSTLNSSNNSTTQPSIVSSSDTLDAYVNGVNGSNGTVSSNGTVEGNNNEGCATCPKVGDLILYHRNDELKNK